LARAALLRRLGYPAHQVHDGGGAAPADGWQPLGDDLMALLYAADRLDHVRAIVAPALAAGTTVICDRYRLSSLAYQALGADEAWIAALNSKAPPPQLTLFLDVPLEVCLARMAARRGTVELYEERAKLARVRANYERLIAQERAAGAPLAVVDGNGSPTAVTDALAAACTVALGLVYYGQPHCLLFPAGHPERSRR
jgi:dTMP kinase